MKANCPIRSAFSTKVTISCESRVQNRIFLLIYKEISRFPALSKNVQAERNGKSCLHEFANCRGAAVVLQRTCKPSAMSVKLA